MARTFGSKSKRLLENRCVCGRNLLYPAQETANGNVYCRCGRLYVKNGKGNLEGHGMARKPKLKRRG